MKEKQSTLTSSEAQAYYDKFGKKQDAQGFYEDPALDNLIAHAGFQDLRKIFEFGCGTCKFAERLLAEYMSSSATYLGCDVSSTMVDLATQRLGNLKELLSKLPRDQEIVAYCRGPYCVLAIQAVQMLRGQGFEAIRLEEGIQDWRAMGLPLEIGD